MRIRLRQFSNRLNDTFSRLSTGIIDPSECHLACGFEDSTIQLWQLNRSTIGGRKPYASYSKRCCQWSLENSTETSSDDEDDVDATYCRPGTSKAEQNQRFMDQRSDENIL